MLIDKSRRALKGPLNPLGAFDVYEYNKQFRKEHPEYFDPDGLLIFCGEQGSGKTLSAVQYVRKVCELYPQCILCTNVDMTGLPESVRVVEYDGIDCLKNLQNGYAGVIYFIDEIHLEFNSLESKNIDIDVMIEISQQRKQRKHIVGTTQIYMRMAKPLREQVKYVVLCHKVFGVFQVNTLIDGFASTEKDGKLDATVIKKYFWTHRPEMYLCYDTYAKMRRYNKEWNGRSRDVRSY